MDFLEFRCRPIRSIGSW